MYGRELLVVLICKIETFGICNFSEIVQFSSRYTDTIADMIDLSVIQRN